MVAVGRAAVEGPRVLSVTYCIADDAFPGKASNRFFSDKINPAERIPRQHHKVLRRRSDQTFWIKEIFRLALLRMTEFF
jgi:hypothetical protein